MFHWKTVLKTIKRVSDKCFREIFCMKSLLPKLWFFFLSEQIQSIFFKAIISFMIFSNTSVESNIFTNWEFCYNCLQALIIFWSKFQIIIILVLIIFINWFKNSFEIVKWICGWRLLFWSFGKNSRGVLMLEFLLTFDG